MEFNSLPGKTFDERKEQAQYYSFTSLDVPQPDGVVCSPGDKMRCVPTGVQGPRVVHKCEVRSTIHNGFLVKNFTNTNFHINNKKQSSLPNSTLMALEGPKPLPIKRVPGE